MRTRCLAWCLCLLLCTPSAAPRQAMFPEPLGPDDGADALYERPLEPDEMQGATEDWAREWQQRMERLRAQRERAILREQEQRRATADAEARRRLEQERQMTEAAQRVVDEMYAELKAAMERGEACNGDSTPYPWPVTETVEYIGERIRDRLLWWAVGESSQDSLDYLLFFSGQPSEMKLDNPWVAHTKAPTIYYEGLPFKVSREFALAMKVYKAPGPLEPKDLLSMALRICGGDYDSATLTLHNFLKELAYGSPTRSSDARRKTYMVRSGQADAATRLHETHAFDALGSPFTFSLTPDGQWTQIGENYTSTVLEDKLANLRLPEAVDQKHGDKLGPWYHMFGLLYVATQSPGGRLTSRAMGWTESTLRHGPGFSSPPDYFKEEINRVAAAQSGPLMDLLKECRERQNQTAGFVTQVQQQRDWYCTNRPQIDIHCPLPTTIRRGDVPRPNSAAYHRAIDDLYASLAERGVAREPLEKFNQALHRHLRRMRSVDDVPAFLRLSIPAGPAPADDAGLAAWRDHMAEAAQAWWLRMLATGSRQLMTQRFEHMEATAPEFASEARAAAAAVSASAMAP